ncbi:MAG: ATP-dependent Clp protease adaptor ClpS [Bacteroidetes bacterium]|nr:MAG: ATP-dependent Clp protease adaptor ClpS [Bacteroidota bacterium]
MTERTNNPEHSDSSLFKDKTEQNLILYNDDYNDFDFVIKSLMIICGHFQEQATQCAVIAHYNGKSSVKKGSYSHLKPMKTALIDKGLIAGIE